MVDQGVYETLVPAPTPTLTPTATPLPTFISFDDLGGAPCSFGAAQPLRDRYAGLGVTFEGPNAADGGAILGQCSGIGVTGFSSPNYLAFNSGATLANGGLAKLPERIRFEAPVASVSLKVASATGSGTAVLRAYDAAGTLLASKLLFLKTAMQPLSVSATGISSVTLSAGSASYVMVVDDLSWTP